MSSFADDLFTDFALPVLTEYLAEQTVGVYVTPRGKPMGSYTAILGPVTTTRIEGDGRTLEHELIAKFPKQPGLPFWDGRKLVGLVVRIGEEDWALDLVEDLSDSLATVRLTRRATSEVSRPGFRRK